MVAAPSVQSFELRTAPLALIARWYTLEALFRLDQNWSLGISYIHYGAAPRGNMFLPSLRGNAWGGVITYRFESHWYVTGRYHDSNLDSYPHGKGEQIHFSGSVVTLVGGHQVNFSENFFAMMGAGIQIGFLDKRTENLWTGVVTRDPSYFAAAPYFEFKVGLAL